MQLRLLPRLLVRGDRPHRTRGETEAHDVGRGRAMHLLHVYLGLPLAGGRPRVWRALRRRRDRLLLHVLSLLWDLLAGTL